MTGTVAACGMARSGLPSPPSPTWPASLAISLALHGLLAAVLLQRAPAVDLEAGASTIAVELATEESLSAGQNEPQSEAQQQAEAEKQTTPERLPEAPRTENPEAEAAAPPEPKEQAMATDSAAPQPQVEAGSTEREVAPSATEKAPAPGENAAKLAKAIMDWRHDLARRIQKFHRYPKAAHRERGEARIAFSIDGDGRLLTERLIGSSGNEILDRDAIALIAKAAPFPPPPTGSPPEFRQITAPIRYDSALR